MQKDIFSILWMLPHSKVSIASRAGLMHNFVDTTNNLMLNIEFIKSLDSLNS